MTDLQDYLVFGLHVRSELALPELFLAPTPGDPDVVIRLGAITDPIADVGVHAVAGGLLFVAPGVGRYLVRQGDEILVEPVAGVPARNLRLYLLGSAFGGLLHQRGLLPLHANAVEVDGQAIAFLGPSGAGKSTLAMGFHDRGLRVIADDICVVRSTQEEPPQVSPGLPRFRLWQEALEATGRLAGHYERSYAGDEEFNKFDVPIGAEATASQDSRLRALYILAEAEEFAILQLHGIEAVEQVFANTYRGGYLNAANGARNHWSSVIQLVRQVPVYRLSRPLGLGRLDLDCRQILDHSRSAQQRSERLAG